MKSEDIIFMPAVEMEKLIRRKAISPVEIMHALFQRIHELNPSLNAYLTLNEDVAMEEAKEAEKAVMRKDVLKPLHGLPISIKDLTDTRGLRTTYGSLVYKDYVPEKDDIVVEKVRQNGAIILGKTNTPEFGRSTVTSNRLGDDCRNPWDRKRTTSGSSGGAAAAVASGLGPLAVGSDGGGSIRLPAALCGVYGLKPTFGRIAKEWKGLINPFTHLGPITRTVADAALLLSCLSGSDPRDPVSIEDKMFNCTDLSQNNTKKMKIAWTKNFGYARVSQDVMMLVEEAVEVFRALGFNVEEAMPPQEPPDIKIAFDLSRLYTHYGDLLKEHADELAPYMKWNLDLCGEIRGHELYKALSGLHYYRQEMSRFFSKYDALILPTATEPAPLIGTRRPNANILLEMITRVHKYSADVEQRIKGAELDFDMVDPKLTQTFNVSGNPAASIPCGFSGEGLPVGMQIVGKMGDDVTVLRLSAAYEKARPWQNHIPDLT